MPTLAPALLRALPSSSRPLAALADRLRSHRAHFALTETVAAARPYLIGSLYAALGGQMLVITPTADVAERTFSDLSYWLADQAESLALVRPADEQIGTLDNPTERAARMAALGRLAAGLPALVVAPLAALRQALAPPAVLREARIEIAEGKPLDFEATLQRLHRLGYRRVDVVSAAGEYAVRGGILDLFPPDQPLPVRVELWGDDVEEIRAFEIESQRSTQRVAQITAGAWLEVLRDDTLRARVVERAAGEDGVVSAVRAFLAAGHDVPAAWTGLAYAQPATLLDYLDERGVVVLEEPATLASLERAVDEESARGRLRTVAEADAEGQLAVDQALVGEALLTALEVPRPALAGCGAALRERALLSIPGGIDAEHPAWLPPVLERHAVSSANAEHFNRSIDLFLSAAREWQAAGETLAIVTTSSTRVRELLRGAGLEPDQTPVHLHLRSVAGAGAALRAHLFVDQGSIEHGFVLPDQRLRVLGDRELFGQPVRRAKLRAVKEGVPVTLAELKVGAFVVHAVHGIGQYVGLRTETVLGATSDYLDLRYAGNDRLLVPVHQMHQVTLFSAADGAAPRLSKMGGSDWARTKARVGDAISKIADELVALYAEREMAQGHVFPPDTPWQTELEEAFPYDETRDQLKAIADIKDDMERGRPMDRLLCGDVGYGKTEVAIRAAFKVLTDHKQVALLAPTTILAAQHERTFKERFAGFPVRVEQLSRFKNKKEQQAILADLAAGKVDVVVGTHRLLQKDVVFRDLGMIIVDEEQRFGVKHKERLKEMRASVDVLTMSATPIPRTLHMSLIGVRDLSLIQTPPKNRMSVKTVVVPTDDALIVRAIQYELDRGGQVYFVHNRVETIYGVKNALQTLLPSARIAVAHGQMGEAEIEPVMSAFVDGEIDILLATTIIENGLDIPNANTLIVNNADQFGLSQLYQLRGRVGRSNHQAYAYLLYQPHKALTEEAKARLEAIREFSHLGSGLQLAMRDLEIRGAGNLLGHAQSGHIAAVGFDTYCQLLAEAVAERQGKVREQAQEAVLDLKLTAYIPDDYITQASQKIAVYQQLAAARSAQEVDEIAAGLRDRFGPMPEPLQYLVEITKLRTLALRKRVTRLVVDDHRLVLGVGTGFELSPRAIPDLQRLTGGHFRFSDQRLTVDLPDGSPATWLPLLGALLETL